MYIMIYYIKQICGIRSLILSLWPVHFFFTFLAYTDVGSVFFVLLAIDCVGEVSFFSFSDSHTTTTTTTTQPYYFYGMVALSAAILFRQTNAVRRERERECVCVNGVVKKHNFFSFATVGVLFVSHLCYSIPLFISCIFFKSKDMGNVCIGNLVVTLLGTNSRMETTTGSLSW
jgi:hypothetical protein